MHFGAHKTGTSVIQSALRDRATGLAAAGIGVIEPRHPVFPEMRLGAANRHLADDRAARERSKTFKPLVRAAKALAQPVVVISHEGLLGPQLPRPGSAEGQPLYGSARVRFSALRDATRSPIRAVIYIRGQAGFLRSQYSQWLKKGIVLDFEPWIELIDLDALSWRPIIDAAAETFGRDRVLVKSFSLPAIGMHQHVTEFFSEALHTDVPGGQLEIRNPNISLSATGIRLARAIADVPLEPADRHAVAGFLSKRFAMAEGREPFDPLSQAVKDRLAARYDEENRAIIAEYGPPSDADRPIL